MPGWWSRNSGKEKSETMGNEPRRYGVLIGFGMPALTLLVYYLWLCVHEHSGAFFVPTLQNFYIPAPTLDAVVIFAVWIIFQAILQIVVPGRIELGTPLPDGTRLSYKLNGWVSFCITLAAFFLAV